jgi:hypothetical protein
VQFSTAINEQISSGVDTVEAIPAFNDYVRQLAHTLLNQTDAWAGQRQAPQGVKSRQRLAQVGVEVFAYVERENAPRRGKLA